MNIAGNEILCFAVILWSSVYLPALWLPSIAMLCRALLVQI
jgi:hypothetical protein